MAAAPASATPVPVATAVPVVAAAAPTATAVAPSGASIRVTVILTNRSNKAIELELKSSDSVRVIKERVHALGFEDPINQYLFHSGSALVDPSASLASVGIADHSIIQMVIYMTNNYAYALELEEKRGIDLAIEAGRTAPAPNANSAAATAATATAATASAAAAGGGSGGAASNGVLESLLGVGANPNLHQKRFGLTALMTAAIAGATPATLQTLLAAGADVHATDKTGKTPLMYACQFGHETFARGLIAAGSAVDASAKTGKTPLMYAARGGSFACAALLIAANARIDATTNTEPKVTALSLATDPEVKKLLTLMREKKIREKVPPELV